MSPAIGSRLGGQGAGVDSAHAASVARTNADLAQLRETRRLIAVEPDFGDSETPANLMDPNLAIQALQIGKRQAEREAAAIQAAWNSSNTPSLTQPEPLQPSHNS